ncbi:helix-turn-helix domain-containing protein [Tsukamurella soli]|uniref:DUF2637 domain-containing protein n=1 Tax=Tsukamurella soli TaxID=644556 RepID=A0ABP8KBZ0_9ACTN
MSAISEVEAHARAAQELAVECSDSTTALAAYAGAIAAAGVTRALTGVRLADALLHVVAGDPLYAVAHRELSLADRRAIGRWVHAEWPRITVAAAGIEAAAEVLREPVTAADRVAAAHRAAGRQLALEHERGAAGVVHCGVIAEVRWRVGEEGDDPISVYRRLLMGDPLAALAADQLGVVASSGLAAWIASVALRECARERPAEHGVGGMSPQAYWRGLLAVSVTTSIALNVAHVLIATGPHRGVAVAVAAVPPGMLFAVTHGLAATADAGVRRAVYRVAVTGAAALALGAFAASYIAIRDLALALAYPRVVAAILPVIVDCAIAVASAMLLAVRPTDVTQADDAGGDPRITAAAQSPVDAPASEPAPTPSSVPTPPVTHPLMQPHHAASAPATCADPTPAPMPAVQAVGDGGAADADGAADAGGDAGDAAPRHAVRARVLALAADGASSRAIAAETGVSASTVLRIVRSASAG